jgi:predicted acyltransferase
MPEKKAERLLSLDLFRGATMFLLVGESTELYHHALEFSREGSLLHGLALQFHHHPWNGLRFWDLVQPFFMFIVGVAMVFSLQKRVQKPDDWRKARNHIFKRCALLFAFGVLLHCVYSGQLVWELWNVLTQLSVTILIAFFLFKFPLKTQIAASFGLLLLTELLYRLVLVEGFTEPFVQGQNFGAWMDTVLMGKINGGGWVTINALPTAAHTIWGVVAGKVLIADSSPAEKLRPLIIAGVIGLVLGYSMDLLGITPIIKRIATTSFTIASGGWCLLVLAFSYWLVDVRRVHTGVFFFSIVGMNSIFIYLFTQTVGHQWVNDFTAIFTNGTLEILGVNAEIMAIAASIAVFALYWYLCYWLYQRKIFFKI